MLWNKVMFRFYLVNIPEKFRETGFLDFYLKTFPKISLQNVLYVNLYLYIYILSVLLYLYLYIISV